MDRQNMNINELDIKIVKKLLESNTFESTTKLAEYLFETPTDYSLKINDNLVRAHAKKLQKYGILNTQQNANVTLYKINKEMIKKSDNKIHLIIKSSDDKIELYVIL